VENLINKLKTNLCMNPIFMLGLIIKILFIISVSPNVVTNFFIPFLDSSILYFSFDPWSNWISLGGNPLAFPYGYIMWFSFLPSLFVIKAMGISVNFAYPLTLLIFDFLLLITLKNFLIKKINLLLITYWLSPIVIFATYGFGFNDVIPSVFLILSILNVKKLNFKLAAILIAIAISAKLSVIVSLPIFIIYIFQNRSTRKYIKNFIIYFFLCSLLIQIPFLFSGSGLEMLISNPEIKKVFNLKLILSDDLYIYLLPLTYLLMIYSIWRVKRLNFELFQSITGITFLLIVLMTPLSPGWFVWSVPFLVLYQSKCNKLSIIFIIFFSILYLFTTLLSTPINFINGDAFYLTQDTILSNFNSEKLFSLFQTFLTAVGIILVMRISREAISQNEFFRLSRKPFAIGIAGDSGSGKDTLTNAIADLFGAHSVVKLQGDNYHFWDRHTPVWRVLTHSNPMSNNLESFSRDLLSLIDGQSIKVREYNHDTGKSEKAVTIRSNDFVIANGLHALHLPILRECYDLKIFLNIDNKLREFFKIQRDVSERGYHLDKVLETMDKRKLDSIKFICPQIEYADLIFSLKPINKIDEKKINQVVKLKLEVTTRYQFNEISLNRVLVGICGLNVDTLSDNQNKEFKIIIEGDVQGQDVEAAAKILCPRAIDFLDTPPKWANGMIGIMQLISLSHISQVLLKRVI
jgi:uridine kinase